MKKDRFQISLLMIAALVLPGAARAQDFVQEALASFPVQTIRAEYSNPAKLRTLPNYANLRQRYVGPRLRALEESFSQLGVQESDINELVLGWQSGAGNMELGGLVAGRFSSQAIAERALAQGISPETVGELPAYCLGSGMARACVAVLRDSLGAFGTAELLGTMLDAREGRAPSITSDERFMKLVSEARGQAPIWGVAVREAVSDWFKAWLPARQNLQMDWASAFQSVEALAYSVDAGEKVSLDVKLDCTTPEAATSTRQVLEGLRLFQQLAWQNLNPNRPNPFEAVELSQSDRRVLLKLATGYADLEGAAALGMP